jgi:hypothetical protein
LLTRTPTGPHSASAAFSAAMSRTSACHQRAPVSSATWAAAPASMSMKPTSEHCAAKARTSSAPIPEPPPVTNTRRPSSER